MLELLLYSTLTCRQAEEVMLRVLKHEDLPVLVQVELVETIKESVPECYWDAND